MRTPAFAILFVAACGGSGGTDIQGTLLFADRSDLEIARLVSAASGSDGFQAQGQLSQFDDPFEPDPCPLVVEDLAANQVTITGGCTTVDGTSIEGSAVIDNPLGWGDNLEYDFSEPTLHTFDGFALVFEGGIRMAYDGTFMIASSYQNLDMDLVVESFGITVRSDLAMSCDAGRTCTVENSGLELEGAGGVIVSGSIGVNGQSVSGGFTLRGIDTVRVTMANNCVSWMLEGTNRGMACP